MEVWLEIGLVAHGVLGIFAGSAVLFTALAVIRSPKADPGTPGRRPASPGAGEPGMRLVAPAPAGS